MVNINTKEYFVERLKETQKLISKGDPSIMGSFSHSYGSIDNHSFIANNTSLYNNVLSPIFMEINKKANDAGKKPVTDGMRFIISDGNTEKEKTSYNPETKTLTININDVSNLTKDELTAKIKTEMDKALNPKTKENPILELLKDANPFRAAVDVSPADTLPSPLANMQPQKGVGGNNKFV